MPLENTTENTLETLYQQFDKIGMAKTRLSRWDLKKAKHKSKIKGYINEISEAAVLDKYELNVKKSRHKARAAHEREQNEQSSLIDKTYKGINNLFNLAFVPVWDAIMELVYYRRRPLYNALRLGLAILVMGGIIAAAIYFPVILAPILLELSNFYLLGTALLSVVGLLAFRLVFSGATEVADKIDTKEAYYLSTQQVNAWQAETQLDENTLKMMKQYLLNVSKQAVNPNVKFTINRLIQNEFAIPSESHIKKLAIFFMHQLEDLRREQQKHPEAQKEQVELDIKVLTYILDQFGYIEILPAQTRQAIHDMEQTLLQPGYPLILSSGSSRYRGPDVALKADGKLDSKPSLGSDSVSPTPSKLKPKPFWDRLLGKK